eukprot:TRINITY_DN14382_c2_g2_i1.p1 TRINITY_DN14382_c2_g2~~TRINITY_DN14382_c2_g2_i1.p1  ORF type:complete len:722 (+),score=112.55 TRINITY_DN14382_c2_g2_i1:43-2166(+)
MMRPLLALLAAFSASAVNITTVHVVQSCHLDVGFANSAVGIINLYFDHHIPYAMQVASELQGTGYGLQFMAQTYYISLYLDCPPGMGLHCPTVEKQNDLRAALKNGTIYYHAFPHNAELEVGTVDVIKEGIQQTHALDDLLKVPRKRTLSQRDVPGMTRSVIPTLLAENITTISVGVNTASSYPKVPRIFRWHDTTSGKEIYAMWHPKGYGGFARNESVIVPGLSHALVTDWNGDNAGPKSAKDYLADFAKIQAEFPGAQIVSSTFDNFTQHLDSVRDNIPVVYKEIGDSWIYGVPSDPKKVSTMMAMQRAWSKYLSQGGARDAVYLNATRLMLKGIEHTWGRDVKSNLKDNVDWDNNAFEYARTRGIDKSQFQILESSWWEQRDWAIKYPLDTLKSASHPLYKLVEEELANSTPQIPSTQGMRKVTNLGVKYSFGKGQQIGFSPTTGAVTTLTSASGVQMASESHPLLLLNYTSYSQSDYQTFFNDYCSLPNPPDWFAHDFGKPGDNYSKHQAWVTEPVEMYVDSRNTSFVLKLKMNDASAHVDYGAPEYFYVSLKVRSTGLDVNLTVWNKTTTRLPESMFVMFNPVGVKGFSMKKVSEWIPINDTSIVDGGSTHLHGVEAAMLSLSQEHQDIVVSSVDAKVLNLGIPSGFPTPENSAADIADFGVSSVLWNNLWGTNYVMWYPFNRDGVPVQGEENLLYRFSVDW